MQYNYNKTSKQMNKVKIPVVFDVDGNIINTEKEQHIFYHDALQNVFKNNPLILAKIEKIIPCNSVGQQWYINNLMGNATEQQKILSETFTDIDNNTLQKIHTFVEKRIKETASPKSVFPGTKELFQKLSQDHRVEVYLISGGSHDCIFEELTRSGLMKYVKPENIYTIETYKKSKGEKLFEIMNKHNISPDMMIMSGDGIKDMSATICLGNGQKAYAIGNLGIISMIGNNDKITKRKNELLDAGADEIIAPNELNEAVSRNIKRILNNIAIKQVTKPNTAFVTGVQVLLLNAKQQDR